MARKDFTQYVHEFEDDKGVTRYAVAEWDSFHNNWVVPMDARQAKATGCHSECARTLKGIGGYIDRKIALRRARYLYGE